MGYCSTGNRLRQCYPGLRPCISFSFRLDPRLEGRASCRQLRVVLHHQYIHYIISGGLLGQLRSVCIRPYHQGEGQTQYKETCRAEGPINLGGDAFLLNRKGAWHPRSDPGSYPKPGRMEHPQGLLKSVVNLGDVPFSYRWPWSPDGVEDNDFDHLEGQKRVFNRPSVARAVLKTASLLID